MYRPTSAKSLSTDAVGLDADFARDVELVTEDGHTIRGWLVKAQGQERKRNEANPVVLYFPGNSLNRRERISGLREFAAQGFDVLIFDYRGFGDSTGSPTEAALSADAEAIWDYAREDLACEQDRIIVFGESLGGAVALSLWDDVTGGAKRPATVILNSTFVSMPRTVRSLYPMFPFDWLLLDHWPSIERIGNIPSPVIVFHGTDDEMIPVAHGRQLAAAGATARFVEVPGGAHNDLPTMLLRNELKVIRAKLNPLGEDQP